jgi:polysaccharide deacetylase family protein (PEP-CTERM system associated)
MKFLTFDIEDWFHILDHPLTQTPNQWGKFESRVDYGVSIILDLLDQTENKATFFCLGWVGEQYPDVIKKIAARGHHVGSHGYSHQLVYNQNEVEFREDLRLSKSILEDIVGNEINCYRAPGFSILKDTLWAFDVMYEEGIRIDSSVFPTSRSHGGMSNFTVTEPFYLKTNKGSELLEFPINVHKIGSFRFVFSGGGYFRMCPLWLLNSLFKNNPYVMTYFHPRDFDTGQPTIEGLSLFRLFKCYTGIKGCKKKLENVICNNQFKSLDKSDIRNLIDLKYYNFH